MSEPLEMIELHEREVLERNLAVTLPVDADAEPRSWPEPSPSASGFLAPSASGFLAPSASGFLAP